MVGDADLDFWQEQYEDELYDAFDWFFEFEDCTPAWWEETLGMAAARDASASKKKILVIGCGHSKLSGALASHFGAQVVSVDSSASVIGRMRKAEPTLSWHVCDCRDLSSLNEDGDTATYDAVVDKGLLDALLVYHSASGDDSASRASSEASRVLRPGGRFLVISCLRAPAPDLPMGGSDGYGGGECRARVFVSGPAWSVVEYCELSNPRPPSGDHRCGPIAPAFEDVCPTHYGIIVAGRAEGAEGTERSGQSHDATYDAAGTPLASAMASVETTRAAARTAMAAAGLGEFAEPSLKDYDDYYSGRFLGEPPAPHDAFVSWRGLSPMVAEQLGPFLRKQPHPRVLDVGCGSSLVAPGIKNLFPAAHVCGVDVIPSAVEVWGLAAASPRCGCLSLTCTFAATTGPGRSISFSHMVGCRLPQPAARP